MNHKKLEQLKEEYQNIAIPEELNFVVRNSIKQGRKNMKRKNGIKGVKIASIALAGSLALFTLGVNSSPALAQTLSKVPVLGGVVKVITFREYKLDENNYNADIKVPEIQGLGNKELENSLNEKYIREGKEFYGQFIREVEELKKAGDSHLGIDSGYRIITDNDKILSIGRYVVNTAASSSTQFKYDTVDKEKQILLTLPMLFKDQTYVDIISENIKTQMKEQMNSDDNKIYWIKGYGADEFVDAFEKISPNHNFYINPERELVICFNEYEVAPGYMGTPEFVIPREVLSEVLVGSEYIK